MLILGGRRGITAKTINGKRLKKRKKYQPKMSGGMSIKAKRVLSRVYGLVFPMKARTVVGRGEVNLLCDPGSEFTSFMWS